MSENTSLRGEIPAAARRRAGHRTTLRQHDRKNPGPFEKPHGSGRVRPGQHRSEFAAQPLPGEFAALRGETADRASGRRVQPNKKTTTSN
ncbi:MAG: hypothetical protein V8T86_01085 [Victivallis sp.]